MLNTPVRVGIVGCGAISEHLHVPDLKVCPDAKVTAFCDLDKARAKELATRFAPDARIFSDYNDLYASNEVDAVVVTLPNVHHGPATIAALKAGLDVMVEKPMATSAVEAQKMVDTAKKAGKLLMVNQSQRRAPAHRKAKEVLDSGILGKILFVSAMFGHSGPENWSPSGKWFFQKKNARFGAMADLGVHKADLLRFLTGKEIVEIGAFSERLEKKSANVEDNFASCIKFSDGAIGMLGASWTVKGKSADYTYLHCENGTLHIQVTAERPLVAYMHHPKCEIVFDIPTDFDKYEGSWGQDVGGGFIRAILGKEPPFCTGEEGKKSLEVILAAEKAASTGKTVKLKP